MISWLTKACSLRWVVFISWMCSHSDLVLFLFSHSVVQSCAKSLQSSNSANPWSVAYQAPLSMGFPRQEYWSALPFPSPGELPDPGIKPVSHSLAGGFFTTKPPRRPNGILLLLLLSRFSHVRLCATPQMAAHQAPPSLGFSRQEHWSGLPFPSPRHESEKWKWSCSVVSDS